MWFVNYLTFINFPVTLQIFFSFSYNIKTKLMIIYLVFFKQSYPILLLILFFCLKHLAFSPLFFGLSHLNIFFPTPLQVFPPSFFSPSFLYISPFSFFFPHLCIYPSNFHSIFSCFSSFFPPFFWTSTQTSYFYLLYF